MVPCPSIAKDGRKGEALLYNRDDGPITSMAGHIVTVELWCIEPRRLASVEKEGIVAAKAFAENPGEFIEAHPAFGDHEVHIGRARHADSIPWFTIG